MQKELVSVVIPVYNVEQYLDRCVESVVNQSYKNLEIILVDDGSTDSSSALCDKWANQDNRIQVIHKPNGGLSDARNVGYAASSGEYISFIDSDDWIEDDFIETLADALDKGSDIADCATRLCDEENNTLLIRGFGNDRIIDKKNALCFLLNEKAVYQTVWNKLYKRACIQHIKFEYGKLHEDNFWTWQVFLNAEKVYVSSKPLYNYLQRNSGIMGQRYSLKRLDALEATYKCYCVLINDNDYKNAVVRKLVAESLYHMQCAFKYLNKNDRKIAVNTIFEYLNQSGVKRYKTSLKSYWYKLFILFPKMTVVIRNILNIGF